MAKRKLPKPTNSELAILRVLWERGPSTVRQVQEELNREKPTGYTTALKFLQIMKDKGLVQRDATSRAHVYEPAISQDRTQRRLLKDILDKAFGGSAARLVALALATGNISTEELAEIRQLLAEHGEDQK